MYYLFDETTVKNIKKNEAELWKVINQLKAAPFWKTDTE